MILRLTIFLTGILSFLYFLRPDVFPTKRKLEDTLGISSVAAAANATIVRQALLIHCINHGKLPVKLNYLYKDELSKDKFVDLDSLFEFTNKGNCEFELIPK